MDEQVAIALDRDVDVPQPNHGQLEPGPVNSRPLGTEDQLEVCPVLYRPFEDRVNLGPGQRLALHVGQHQLHLRGKALKDAGGEVRLPAE